MCRNGDIYLTQLDGQAEGSLQAGMRPVFIISNNKANKFSPVITVIPVTSKMGKNQLPTHVYIRDCGLAKPSIAMAEQITSINKSKLRKRIGSIKRTEYERQVRKAVEIQLNL